MTEKKIDPHRKLMEILEEMNQRGKFRASVFATDEGLVLSSNQNPQISEAKVGAMATLLAEAAARAETEVEMKNFQSIKISYESGEIICRAIKVKDKTFLMAILADPPPNEQYAKYYDELLNWAADVGKDALNELISL
ncbi:MAG: hypothetical protein ACTSWN_04555 [Promethearchaeota archaeon]